MDYNRINKKILEVYIKNNVRSFSIDCISLIKNYGFKIWTFNDLKNKNRELYELCVTFSNDSFNDINNKIIVYNEHNTNGRIAFSLMHELGHFILEHIGESKQNEIEANYFASNILAPRMAIYYAGCVNANDVHRIFKLTYEASEYAFNDFRRWRRNMVTHKNSFSAFDMEMYNHFYNKEINHFVWNERKCPKCGSYIYNDIFTNKCKQCKQNENYHKSKPPLYDDPVYGLFCDERSQRNIAIARNKWLYGNDL